MCSLVETVSKNDQLSSSSTVVVPHPSDQNTTAADSHIFRSRLPPIPISDHLPLHDYCFERSFQYPDRICLIQPHTNETYTYAQTRLISRKVAAGLSKHGIKPGQVIMLLLQNCAEFVFSFLGASMIGAITTAANPLFTSAEIFKQLTASKAKLVITQSLYAHKLRDNSLSADFTVITIDDPPENCLHFSVLSEADNQNHHPEVKDPSSGNDPVALPFSSGTTGLPKGVILTHRSLITGVAQQVDGDNPNLYLKPDDVVLCVLPLFHIYSLNSVLLCSLRAGAAVLLMPKFEIKALLELIQKHRVSVAAVVPPLVVALAKNPVVDSYDLSSIRVVLSGAAPLGKELESALRTRLPQAVFGQGYGMTEAGPVLSMSPCFAKQPLPCKSGSCGTVVRNAEMKVLDPETGSCLPRNHPGEICIRGSQIMRGYLNDEEATARTIDQEGWLHTGDIGFVDDDDEVFIVDRVKEIIKFKGFQVPPAELEGLLLTHPNLTDAAVVPQKDEVAGEVPVAFVVRSNNVDLEEEAVKEFIAKQVVFYKRLHKVYFVHSIPKSASGKILRKDLRARLPPSSSSCC